MPRPSNAALPVLLLGLSTSLQADPPQLDEGISGPCVDSWMVQLDNDLFAGSDRDYTNGFRVAFGGPTGLEPDYGRLRTWLRRFSGDDDSYPVFGRLADFDLETLDYSWGVGLTQLMFTPDKHVPRTPPPGERPYAAWLGAEFSMQVRDENSLSSVALAIGVTGDWALGEQTQDIVHHDISHSPLFNGWDSQLQEEVTIDLLLDHKRRIRFLDGWQHGAWGVDGYYEFGGSLGTLRTAAYFGGLVRAGWNLPATYSVPRLQLASYSNLYFNNRPHEPHGFRAYFLGGARGSLVLHDATLDGSLFQDWRHAVGSRPLVGELVFGFGMGLGEFELIYSRVLRSDEFDGQNTNQEYGSMQVVWQKRF